MGTASGQITLPAGRPILAATTPTSTKTSTTSASTAVAAKAATSASASSIAAILSWSSGVDREIPSIQIFAVKLFDGFLSFFFRCHLNETEATRSSCVAILDHRGGLDRPYCTE
jgi:hypothetical protein